MVFYLPDIFHFRSPGCPLWSHPGSLRQKCDPDKYSQNSNKNRLCFFTHQTFSIFTPSAGPWDTILDPCGKSVILTGARKIQIKSVYVFLPIRHFPFSLLWSSLRIPSWVPAGNVWSWQVFAKFKWTSFMFFHPPDIFHFRSFGCPLGSHPGSLRQKCVRRW
jgi:hypothetical protein